MGGNIIIFSEKNFLCVLSFFVFLDNYVLLSRIEWFLVSFPTEFFFEHFIFGKRRKAKIEECQEWKKKSYICYTILIAYFVN